MKNKQVKKSKSGDLFKGVSPWLWSKTGNVYMFLF